MLKLNVHRLVPTLCLIALGLLSGCTIVKTATPAPTGTKIGTIYVQRNRNVHMEGLHDEIIAQLRSLGFTAETTEGARPEKAKHLMTYTANWRWDMAMYLTYFQVTLLEDSQILGRAEYDATRGGARMDKFGKTSEKIRPLLQDLLQNTQKISAPGTMGTANP